MLNVTDLNVSYGASQALYNVSLNADVGKVTCVLGRNGVGKTTLMKSLAGHLAPGSGDITWDGKSIMKLAPYDRAKQGIAFVPQGRDIFPQLTVEENLQTAFSAVPRSQRFIDPEVFSLFPVLQKMLKRRGGDLSGGQQQQLAIARALLLRPKMLILDEPTEGIQPNIVLDIESAVQQIISQAGISVLLVEQHLHFVRQADRYYAMQRGGIVASGPTQELSRAVVDQFLSV